MKRFMICTAAAVVIVMVLVIGLLTVKSSARSVNADRPRIYKSIMIESGDTLWEISERYAGDLDMDTREYLSELKQVNGLDYDRIIAGTHLIVISAAQD